MKFEITTMDLIENQYGKNDLVISKVKLMDDDGRYIKFAKLNEALVEAIKDSGIVSIKK